MNEQTIITLAILGGALLVCALVMMAYLIRRTVIATIAGFSWSRKVILEHYIWVPESSYSGFPAGSRNQRSKIETYQSYEYIRTETTTTYVNGQSSTTTRPVYGFVTRTRRKYMYEIQRWVESRRLVAQGEERATVHWPSYTLDRSTRERVKGTREKYLVFFQTARGKTYKRALPEADWTALDEKATYTLKVNLFRQVMQFHPSTEQVAVLPGQTT